MPYPRQTHCPQGHEYTEENTIRWRHGRDGKRWRYCRACQRDKEKRRHAERKARIEALWAAVDAAAAAKGLSRRRFVLATLAHALWRPDPWPSPRPNGKPEGATMKRPQAPVT